MKKLLLVAACMVATVGALAQGTINFNTAPSVIGAGAQVFDTDGTTPLAGTAFFAQLYVGASASSLSPVGVPVNFKTAAGAGYVVAGTVTVPTIAGSQAAFVSLHAWDATAATYEAAVSGKLKAGASAALKVTLGDPNASPPTVPVNLTGLTGFSVSAGAPVIPEPSTIALGLLGMGAFLLRRKLA